MKASPQSCLAVPCVVFLLLSWSSRVHAQTDPTTGLNGKGKKAYSIPISEREIELQITAPPGKGFTVLVREGGMAKVLALGQGYAYALVPTVRMDDKSVDIGIYRLRQDQEGNESLEKVENLIVGSDGAGSTKAEPKLEIRLNKITNPSASKTRPEVRTKDDVQLAFASADKIDCCVTCPSSIGDITVCASAVCADCGSCADPGVKPLKCSPVPPQ